MSKRKVSEALDITNEGAPTRKFIHRVAVPADYVSPSDGPVHGTVEEPAFHGIAAKTYQLVLDGFQRLSVACLERRESLLVAAHTSAGKTAVAEYAVAMALRDKQRVIYTSPIKALSNQKYRDLSHEFSDVGIMTGDLTFSPDASCLVVTTEVLRGMLYHGSEVVKEVSWVIFDEIHYMKDRERGVVWEETIIFLPHGINMVFLSATLSNAFEFAEWVCKLRQRPCHVVFTEFRPTPLRHYGVRRGGSGVYLLVDEGGRFREENFHKLLYEGGGQRQNKVADILRVAKMIIKIKLQPVIFFSFSRLECEKYASAFYKLNFNSEEDMEAVEHVFQNAILCLCEEDRTLPTVELMLPLLKRGIAIHHSGLLPIVKELVELLVQEGLIKVLFATETFAIGLNMPTKTVVFTEVCKWDGDRHRWMSSDEYIQMSGRAGRRGKDDCGNCIVMIDQKMDIETCRKIILGEHAPISSTFKLSYYTLLNLMRRADGQLDTEYLFRSSLAQFQYEKELVEIQEKISKLESNLIGLDAAGDAGLAEYHKLKLSKLHLEKELMDMFLQSELVLSVLVPGRLVKISNNESGWGWGVIANVVKLKKPPMAHRGLSFNSLTGSQNYAYTVYTLLHCTSVMTSDGPQPVPRPCHHGEKGEMHLVPVQLPLISAVSTVKISIPSDLCSVEARRRVLMEVQKQEKQCPNGLHKVDLLKDFNIDNPKLLEIAREISKNEEKLIAHPLDKLEEDEHQYQVFKLKEELHNQGQVLRMKMHNSPLQNFRNESRSRSRVLLQLGHIDINGVVQLKGQVACLIDTADELLVTELIYNGFFHKLDHHQMVAVASCFIVRENSSKETCLRSELAGPLHEIQHCARKIAEVQHACNLDIDIEKYVLSSIIPYLMEAIYCWSKGNRFSQICELTDTFEGSIVWTIKRLDKFLNQLQAVARVVEDHELQKKFEMASHNLRRDILVARSLYL